MTLVMLVDDEPALRAALGRALTDRGYRVAAVPDGESALEQVAQLRPDVIVLDLGLPGRDGIQVCRELRSAGDHTPILVLTARVEVGSRIAGLDAGADDYVPKPFSIDELCARLRALLRRPPLLGASPSHGAPSHQLTFSDVCLDLRTYSATRGGRDLHLTRTEFSLLELFLRNPGIVLSHSVILERVWGYDFGGSNSNLTVYLSYLRRKLEASGEDRIIHNARGFGYVLRTR